MKKKFNIDKQALEGTGFDISDESLYGIVSDSIFAHGKEIKMFKIQGENIKDNTDTFVIRDIKNKKH